MFIPVYWKLTGYVWGDECFCLVIQGMQRKTLPANQLTKRHEAFTLCIDHDVCRLFKGFRPYRNPVKCKNAGFKLRLYPFNGCLPVLRKDRVLKNL